MNKSFSSSRGQSGSVTDRSKAKSTEKELRGMSRTREIVIRTNEPDIPLITILKVERDEQGEVVVGLNSLDRLFVRIQLRNLFCGFSRIGRVGQISRFKLVTANRLAALLRNREKKLLSLSWLKLANLKLNQQSKINTGRLISKLSLFLVQKVKAAALESIRIHAFLRNNRSKTEVETKVEKNENFEAELSTLKSQEFSQKFIALCRKYSKINKNFITGIEAEIEPEVKREIDRYRQLRNNRGLEIGNEVTLLVLNNHIITIKGLRKDLEASNALVSDLEKENNSEQMALYLKIEKEFGDADTEIRNSLEKNQKIEEKQLTLIVENQIKKWTKVKDIPLYGSRLFISALIVKLIKNGSSNFVEFLDNLEELIRASSDNKRLDEIKKEQKNSERSTSLLLQIANKFIDHNLFSMQPIEEKGFSENEELIMEEIAYLKIEIQDFMKKYKNAQDKTKLKKTLSAKKEKSPKELKDLYTSLNELFILIQSSTPKKDNRYEVTVKIVHTFRECLHSENYERWEKFVSQEINKEEYKQILESIDGINDILNEKIGQESSELTKIKQSEAKLKDEINSLKKKNLELEKKVKNLEGQNKDNEALKVSVNEKDKIISEWQAKYDEAIKKMEKTKERNSLESALQKQMADLKKKLEEKDEEIKRLLEENKKLNTTIGGFNNEKSKFEQEKKKLSIIIDKHVTTIEANNGEINKLNEELNKNAQSSSAFETKIRQLEAEIKKLQKQIKDISNKPAPEDKETLAKNEKLTLEINSLTIEIQKLQKLLSTKESEILNLKNQLTKEQKDSTGLQNLKNENEKNIALIKKLEGEISELKRGIDGRDKHILDLESKISQILSDLNSLRSINESLKIEINEKIDIIRQIEIGLNERNAMGEEIHNMDLHIRQLQSILEERDRHINELNLEIYKLKNVTPPPPSDFENRIKELEAHLKQKDIRIAALEKEMNDNSYKFNYEKQSLELEIKNLTIKLKQNESLIDEVRIKGDTIRHLEQTIKSNESRFSVEKQKWETEFKNLLSRNEHLTSENANLGAQLKELNLVIEELKIQLSKTSGSSVNNDNIVWLLTNIISNFIRIHPKPKLNVEAVSEQVFNELISIKNSYSEQENEMFMNFEQYVVRFLEADIAKYKLELEIRIDELTALKERLISYINTEIEFSKSTLTTKYQYELRVGDSTADKSYDTPSVSLDVTEEIRERNFVTQRLFQTNENRIL